MSYDKYIQNGQVGVIVSPGYGAGWSTWAYDADLAQREQICMDRRLVELVLKLGTPDEQCCERTGVTESIEAIAQEIIPDMYCSVDDLTVVWLLPNTMFWIEEYDGSETLRIAANQETMRA